MMLKKEMKVNDLRQVVSVCLLEAVSLPSVTPT